MNDEKLDLFKAGHEKVAFRPWTAKGEPEKDAIEFTPHQAGKAIMKPDQFAAMLDAYLNTGGKGFKEGERVGRTMMQSHRTLQRLCVMFAFGILAGISDAGTDPRNEYAIDAARKIKQEIEKGPGSQFQFGRFL